MSCNCIEEATKKIREVTGDSEASIDTAMAFNVNSTVSNPDVFEWIKMTYTYRPKKRNGEFGRPEKGSLVPTFCPICGEPYKKGDSEEKDKQLYLSGLTVKGIVADWLKDHGFEGLYCNNCGCKINDLMPCDCENAFECKPGYIKKGVKPCDDCEYGAAHCSGECITPSKEEAEAMPLKEGK